MNKVINLARQILMLLVAVLYLVESFLNATNVWTVVLQIVFFFIFFFTTIIDLWKGRMLSTKRNLWQLSFLIIVFVFILRPFIDTLVFSYLHFSLTMALQFSLTIFAQNKIVISVMMILFLINNYVEYQANQN